MNSGKIGTWRKIGGCLRRLHEDERGEIPVGQVLVIGMVVIPLVVALVAFGGALADWLAGIWNNASGSTINTPSFNDSQGGG